MDVEYAIRELRHNAEAIERLARPVSDEQARWKPAPEEWSILEVVNHLYDEEHNDFRLRLDLTLHQPETPWPPNDPMRYVVERRYNEQDLGESLDKFLAEREKSLVWLKSLDSPDWSSLHKHPSGRTLSAADLLASWVAHDALHLRQLAELHYQYAARHFSPATVLYAGDY
jgi:hypothetical protein